MADIKLITAENIARLRSASGMTQAELAQILNYSDKAVSKWERGESLPDVAVLKQISDLFGVTLDYLVNEHKNVEITSPPENKWMSRNHLIITALSILCVWFIATVIFVSGFGAGLNMWLAFIAAIPVSMIVLLVLNSIWGKVRFNLVIISCLIWSLLITIYLILIKYNFWVIFCTGIPLQIAAILSFKFRRNK